MKLSDEDRVFIVKQVLEEGKTPGQVAKELNVDRAHIQALVARVKQLGYSSILHSKRQRSYTPQEKFNVVQYAIQEGSIKVAAAHFGITHSLISKWKSILENDGFAGLAAIKKGRPLKNPTKVPSNVKRKECADKDLILENEKLRKELEQARMENEFLKKLDALVRERIKRESSNSPESSKN